MYHITSDGLEVEYNYWEDRGDYLQPPDVGVEITKITYKENDLTNLLLQISDEYINEMLIPRLIEINS